jgi:hypothetical protein
MSTAAAARDVDVSVVSDVVGGSRRRKGCRGEHEGHLF